MRIDHINFNVSNLKNSVSFYTELFGFTVKESGVSNGSGAPYKIIGHPERFYLCLYENIQDVSQKGFNHFGVNVQDFDSFVEKLKSNNIEILYGGITDWPNSKSAYIQGPDGEEIEITQYFGGKLN